MGQYLLDKQTRNMHDAALYATANQQQKRDASICLAARLPTMNWKTDMERVLDIGSGSGDVTCNLLGTALSVPSMITGVDMSPEMVNYASDTFGSETLDFHLMDIGKAMQPRQMFPSGFTKIFSFYCLHWVPDLSTALNNINQLLEPDGECLLVFLANNPIFRMYRIMAQTSKWRLYMLDVEKFVPLFQDITDPATHFKRFVDKEGFKVKKCEAEEFSFSFQNQNQLVGALKAVNPFITRIPEDKRKEFMADCVLTLMKLDIPLKNGQMEARYKLMVAHLQK